MAMAISAGHLRRRHSGEGRKAKLRALVSSPSSKPKPGSSGNTLHPDCVAEDGSRNESGMTEMVGITIVAPAKAGIHLNLLESMGWSPAFAGVTGKG
jgi:hypothetical protein